MPLSTQQIQENTRVAANLIKQQLGLAELPSTWTYEQRVQYNKTLAKYIQDHPSSFSQSQNVTAAKVSGTAYSPLQDTSFDFKEFVSEIGNQAAEINNDLNPFSEQNRRMLYFLVIGLAVIVVLANSGAAERIASAASKARA